MGLYCITMLCIMVALVALQSEKQFCFVEDNVITKDTAHKGIIDIKPFLNKFKIKPSL